MKTAIALLILVFIVSSAAHAEIRCMIVEITAISPVSKIRIYSDVEKENKSDLSITETTKLLRNAWGFKSSIFLYITSPLNVRKEDLNSLLAAISENFQIELEGVHVGKNPSPGLEEWKRELAAHGNKH